MRAVQGFLKGKCGPLSVLCVILGTIDLEGLSTLARLLRAVDAPRDSFQ